MSKREFPKSYPRDAHLRLSCLLTAVAFAPILISMIGCGQTKTPPEVAAAGKRTPTAFAVNYPLMYFAERIGGGHVDVSFPAPANEDPAFWKPGDEVVQQYQEADLILLNGASYARWVTKVSLPDQRIVNTSKGFEQDYVEIENGAIHTHGPRGEHSHTGVAFTTWIDPALAIQQTAAVRDAFAKLLPEHATEFETNFRSLETDLRALETDLDEAMREYGGEPLLASHPVYQYLARRGKLNLESVLWEPDQLPDVEQWEELQQLLDQHPAKLMLWEAPPDSQTVENLAARGVECVAVDPCGNVPEKGDYLEVMRDNFARLKQAFATGSSK